MNLASHTVDVNLTCRERLSRFTWQFDLRDYHINYRWQLLGLNDYPSWYMYL